MSRNMPGSFNVEVLKNVRKLVYGGRRVMNFCGERFNEPRWLSESGMRDDFEALTDLSNSVSRWGCHHFPQEMR
jgi:hypothetical protein